MAKRNVHLGDVFHSFTARHVEKLVLFDFCLGRLLTLADSATTVALHIFTTRTLSEHKLELPMDGYNEWHIRR